MDEASVTQYIISTFKGVETATALGLRAQPQRGNIPNSSAIARRGL
jgi:hypothetical protein